MFLLPLQGSILFLQLSNSLFIDYNFLLCYFRWCWLLKLCFFGRYGVMVAGGCRGFTSMLHEKMVGIRELVVPSLLSKCELQILVFPLTLIGFLMLTSHLSLWSGSWGRRWNFTPSHSRLSLLLEQPGRLQIWCRGIGWCLTIWLSSDFTIILESYWRSNSREKVWTHEAHSAKKTTTKTSTLSGSSPEINSLEINSHEINSHEINSHEINSNFLEINSCIP